MEKQMEKYSLIFAFGKKLVKLGAKYNDLVVLSADSAGLFALKQFNELFPDRCFNFGIGDQNVIGASAGMTVRKKLPIVCMPALRATEGALEQIRNMICYPNLNVKIFVTEVGLAMGKAGGMAQALEDIALMRALPNMKVVVPVDAEETGQVLETVMNDFGPTYVRMTHLSVPMIEDKKNEFRFGQALKVREGRDTVIFTTGDMVWRALAAADILREKHNLSTSIISISSIKPIDEKTIIQQATRAKFVITMEDHGVMGGLGGAILEVLNGNEIPRKVLCIAMPDVFGESGGMEELYHKHGFDPAEMAKQIITSWNEL